QANLSLRRVNLNDGMQRIEALTARGTPPHGFVLRIGCRILVAAAAKQHERRQDGEASNRSLASEVRREITRSKFSKFHAEALGELNWPSIFGSSRNRCNGELRPACLVQRRETGASAW